MKKMNKYMKATIITVIILALFTIAQRDKIIGYFEPKCIEEGCTEKVVEGTNYCRWHLISDDNDYSGTYHSGTVTTTTTLAFFACTAECILSSTLSHSHV